MTAVFIAVAAQ